MENSDVDHFPNLSLMPSEEEEESSEPEEDVTMDLDTMRQEARLSALPEASRAKYEKVYKNFCAWIVNVGGDIDKLQDDDLAAYFNSKLSLKFAPTTLWSELSAIKSVHAAVGRTVPPLINTCSLLKAKGKKHVKKKAKVFSCEQLQAFLCMDPILEKECPLENLQMRLACLIFLLGGLRKAEISKLKFSDASLDDKGRLVIIIPTQPGMKTGEKVIVSDPYPGNSKLCPVALWKEYLGHVPPKVEEKSRVFLQVQRSTNKAKNQPRGIHWFAELSTKIATRLHLENPKLYTSHSFKRSAATWLANAGANSTDLKRQFGWKSTSVAEGYIEESHDSRARMTGALSQSMAGPGNALSVTPSQAPRILDRFGRGNVQNLSSHSSSVSRIQETCVLNGCTNVTINLNLMK